MRNKKLTEENEKLKEDNYMLRDDKIDLFKKLLKLKGIISNHLKKKKKQS